MNLAIKINSDHQDKMKLWIEFTIDKMKGLLSEIN